MNYLKTNTTVRFLAILTLICGLVVESAGQTTKAKTPQKKGVKAGPAPKHKVTGTTVTREKRVEIRTRYGNIVVKLYNETPQHRDNFLKLVREGFYDSLLFHRIIPEFIIQGGDPDSRTATPEQVLGNGNNGYRIPAEINKKYYHKRGALGAPRDERPDRSSSGCQFYIVQGRKFQGEELVEISTQANYNAKQIVLNAVMQSDSVKSRIEDFKLRGDKQGLQTFINDLQPKVDSIYAPFEFKFESKQIIDYVINGGAPNLDQSYTVFGEVISGMEVVDAIATAKTDERGRPLEDLRIKMRILP